MHGHIFRYLDEIGEAVCIIRLVILLKNTLSLSILARHNRNEVLISNI